jgi:hypothetical protein
MHHKLVGVPQQLNRALRSRPAKLAALAAGLLCFVAYCVLPKETTAQKALATVAFLLCPTLVFWSNAAIWKLWSMFGLWFLGMILSACGALVVAIPLLFVPDDIPWLSMWLRGSVALATFLVCSFAWNRRVQYPFENKIRFRSVQNTLPPPDDYDNVLRW